MSQDNQTIVVKRIRKVAGAHHGGAWKIAYADFVTAMMAFFLLMWLLGSTSQATREGIAEYFSTPLRVTLFGKNEAGESASSVVQGGGKDLSRAEGQVRRTENPEKRRAGLSNPKEPTEKEKRERVDLENLKKKIENLIDDNPKLKLFKKQILLDITAEGLRIQIVDEQNRPMFNLSSSDLMPHTKEILHHIGAELNRVDYRVSLSGHTDAYQYANGDKGISNWELSANRANASRRELIAGGMSPDKVTRVVGHANTINFDKQNLYNPSNRRISIVVLNRRTEAMLMQEGEAIEVTSGDELELR